MTSKNDVFQANHAKFQCDLSDEAAVRALLPQVIAHFGRVDAVVNSAAIFEHDAAATFSYGAMQKHLATNTARRFCCRRRCMTHVSDRKKLGREARGARCGRQSAGPKTLEPKPRFFQLHPEQSRVGSGQHHAGDGACAARCASSAWHRG